MHRAALHVHTERVQSKETLAAIKQGLGLTHSVLPIHQTQGATIVVHVFQIDQALDATIDQSAGRIHLLIMMNPVATFKRCRFVANG